MHTYLDTLLSSQNDTPKVFMDAKPLFESCRQEAAGEHGVLDLLEVKLGWPNIYNLTRTA